MDSFSAANAFVGGDISVTGDLCAAIQFFAGQEHSRIRQGWFTFCAHAGHWMSMLRAGRAAAAWNIGYHYNRSNEFYELFLDSRMQYEAGKFSRPECTLEEAQTEKLTQICRKLGLRPGHRLLDIGCGWGGLLVFAAEHYGIQGVGCTLSEEQRKFAQSVLTGMGIAKRLEVRKIDYRDLSGRFDRVTSVGMFEHVGPHRLSPYFEKVHSLLDDDGLFLNRGIVRPVGISDGPETLFLERSVFPGGKLVHITDIVRAAEKAGFEILELEDYRLDYARTCREWVARLQKNAAKCKLQVGEAAYRTWLLYLAASAVNFEAGRIDAVEILFRKRRPSRV
jgi:cyclopropane-fatty-acyl-phospholipid synthase